jgi:hypothetical protein
MNKWALTVAAAMLSAVFAARAAPVAPDMGAASPSGTIYEWVDDSGLKHASDSVPEKYKGTARRIDMSRFRIPADEQKEAETQAMTLKAKAASVAPALQPPSATTRPVVSRPAGLRGSPPAPDTAECAARRAQLPASLPCYVFSNPDGSHGFYSCANQGVTDTESVCGPEGSR